MEGGNHTGHPLEVGSDSGISTYQARQPAGRWHAPHVHQVVQGLPLRAANGKDAEVHVRGQAAIEFHFPVAEGFPALPSRKVHERQPHGLLELEGPLADEDHDRDVALRHLRFPGPVRWNHPITPKSVVTDISSACAQTNV